MENNIDKVLLQMNELEQKLEKLMRWKSEIEQVVGMLPEAFQNISETMEVNENAINSSLRGLYIFEEHFKNIMQNQDYELNDPRRTPEREKYFYPNILSVDEAIHQIVCNGKSLARFGDGEFEMMSGKQRWKFQELDITLSKRLIEVIRCDEPQLMIGIADNYGMLDRYDLSAAGAIRAYMTPEVRALHQNYLDVNRSYYDAYITRPYIMFEDRMTDAPRKRFEQLKTIWENRNVILIEGAQTRFGAGNDLLSGALSVRRILAPATSSFRRYDELLKEALRVAKDGDLFLVALGPSAGVMVYDLCINGFQAIDIGHADLEYEWFLAGKGERVPVPHKYCNETTGEHIVAEYNEPTYISQIIADYGNIN